MRDFTESGGAFVFAKPEWLDETGSTNDVIRERLAEGGVRAGLVVAARRQTRGRGRMGNAWQQAPGLDLAFSFLWEGEAGPERAGSLPMACALGVADFLASPGLGIAAECKWPNDVMAGGAKICGILTEAGPGRDGRIRLIVGIGVNVGADPGRDARAGIPTASIEGLAGIRIPPETVLERLLPFLASRITAWSRKGFAAVRADFTARMRGLGETVAVRSGGERLTGVVLGLGENGGLRLAGPDGREIVVTSAAALG